VTRHGVSHPRHASSASVAGVLLLDLIAPPRCLACRAPRGDPLCGACRAAMPWLRDACPRCALPRPCAPCPARRAAFAAAWAPAEHEGVARELVLALKLRGSRPAADAMAAMVATTLRAPARGPTPEGPEGSSRPVLEEAVLVPVPAAPERRRARGFDPAALITARLARRTGRPVAACLSRPRGDARQVGRRRGERREGPVIRLTSVAPPVALLVDDVHTTGATLDACARALRSSGAREVYAASFARTARHT
jgi:predicted amidophosphoribosyltransferase